MVLDGAGISKMELESHGLFLVSRSEFSQTFLSSWLPLQDGAIPSGYEML
jgi:hypothetical protein